MIKCNRSEQSWRQHRILAAAIALFIFSVLPLCAIDKKDWSEKRVLILHADNVFLPANRIMDGVLEEGLLKAGIKSSNIFAEYLEEGASPIRSCRGNSGSSLKTATAYCR